MKQENNIVFPTEQSLHDYAELYPPGHVFIAIFYLKLKEEGLDGLNQFLFNMFPPGAEDHEWIAVHRELARMAGLVTAEERKAARISVESAEAEEVGTVSDPAFSQAT